MMTHKQTFTVTLHNNGRPILPGDLWGVLRHAIEFSDCMIDVDRVHDGISSVAPLRVPYPDRDKDKTCPHGRPFNGAHCEGCNT